MKPDSPVKASVDRTESPLPVLNATMAPVTITETSIDPCVEDAAFDMLKMGDDDLVSATDDDDDSFGKVYNVVEEKHEAEVSSESLKKQKAVREKGKKTRAKKEVENTSKRNIPGSANRLKMKEKALLSGVFSKYGGKSSD